MKTCSKCGETKELSEFHKNSRSKDGRRSDCKICQLSQQRSAYSPIRGKAKWTRSRYGSNPEANRERVRRQYWKNPEIERLRSTVKEARRRVQRFGTLTEWDIKLSTQWRKVISEMPCYYCGTTDADSYHVDHRIPVSKGGDDSWVNLVRACESCNLSKSAKTDAEFFGWNFEILAKL